MPKITFKDKQGSIIETVDVPADTSVMEVLQDFILANNTFLASKLFVVAVPFVELVMYT